MKNQKLCNRNERNSYLKEMENKCKSNEFIRTFLSDLDDVPGSKFFGLGEEGAIIEICGPPGSGKTLFW